MAAEVHGLGPPATFCLFDDTHPRVCFTEAEALALTKRSVGAHHHLIDSFVSWGHGSRETPPS